MKNAVQTVSVEVKLTHAKKMEEGDIKRLFNSMTRDTKEFDDGFFGNESYIKFSLGNGDYSLNTYTLKNTTDKKHGIK